MNARDLQTPDYHVHTPYCGHAQGALTEYIEAAVRKGIPELCFSDHLGRYYLTSSQKRRYWDWGMTEKNLPRYVAETHGLRDAYSHLITIRTGLEVDYIEGAEEAATAIFSQYPLDFILGSVHCLPSFGWKHLSHYNVTDSWPLYKEYFDMTNAACASGIIDSLAHLDFIWRYVKWPAGRARQIFARIRETVLIAAEKKVAIEINANAFLWSQLYSIEDGDPLLVLVENLRETGAMITIGSDAHKPEFVGKAFDQLIPVLTANGISSCTVFEKHIPRQISLPT